MYSLTSNWPFIILAYPVFALFIIAGIQKVYIKEKKDVGTIFNPTETNFLRGIAALMVLFTHYAQQLVPAGLMYWYWFFGYLSVGFFMFASGYASYIQYSKKGPAVFKGYTLKRIIRLYIPFVIVDTIFAICYRVSVKNYIRSLFTLMLAKGDEPSNWSSVWFLWAVFYLGIAFMMSFKFIKDQKKALLVDLLLTIGYIIVMYSLGFGFWWYNTALAYFYGILFARYKKQIVDWILKMQLILVPISLVGIAGLVYYMSKGHYTFWPQSLCVVLSLVCIVYIFSKVEIRKKHIFHSIGIASLELFLIQGLRMLVFNDAEVRQGWLLVVWSVLIVALAIFINKISTWLAGKILRKIGR